MLYLPRGRVHAAEAQEGPSIHLTIGIHPPTVMALAVKTLESLSLRDDRLLSQLPPRYLAKAAERAQLGDMVRDALGSIDATALSEGVSALEDVLVRRGRCSLAGRLVADAVDAGQISARTWVERSHPLYSRVLALGDGVALQFAQSLVPAGQDHRGAMLYLSRRTGAFQVGDIPDIAEAQQIELARKLIVDGFLIRLPEA